MFECSGRRDWVAEALPVCSANSSKASALPVLLGANVATLSRRGSAVCTPLIVWSLKQRRVVLSKRSRRGVQGPAVCAPLIVLGRQQHLPGWASALDSDAMACCVYSASSLEPAAAPCSAEQTFPTRYPGACRVYSANSSRNQHCLQCSAVQCSGAAAILLRKACLCTALIVRGRQRRRVGLSKRPRRGVQGPAVCTALIVRAVSGAHCRAEKTPRRGVQGPAVCTALIVRAVSGAHCRSE